MITALQPMAKERPILFSGAMVRAILEGKKTQTRRVVKPLPHENMATASVGLNGVLDVAYFYNTDRTTMQFRTCPYGRISDRLWVRETHGEVLIVNKVTGEERTQLIYRAENENYDRFGMVGGGWKPSIFMRRAASRLTLEVTDVRVQRLQDVSEEDAIAEGIVDCGLGSEQWQIYGSKGEYNGITRDPIHSYKSLWDSINADKHSWASNPWVWAVSFTKLDIKI